MCFWLSIRKINSPPLGARLNDFANTNEAAIFAASLYIYLHIDIERTFKISLQSKLSDKSARFSESVIRAMTQRCLQYNAINLSQGTPAYQPPPEVKAAAIAAIQEGYNQYSITWGAPAFREAIAQKMTAFNGIPTDPNRNVTVTCGSTEGMLSALLAVINPGDEIIIFEPFYENYGPDTIISGAKPVYVALQETPTSDGTRHFTYDPTELRDAFSANTKAIIINTPNNPLGKVFTGDELQQIADLCCEYDCLAITDEIYEHMIYDEKPHISIGALPQMRDRTITVSGLSKAYSMTGWRLGYVIAHETLTDAIRKDARLPHSRRATSAPACRGCCP